MWDPVAFPAVMDDPAGNIYVAIVDDDESICRSLGRLLRAVGIQPITYHSAEDFLSDDKRPQFDCLVLDVQLTGMTGIELQQRLALSGVVIGAKSAPPIIFITAHDDPEAQEQATRAGCIAFFRKTAPGEAVVRAIREVVARRAGERREW